MLRHQVREEITREYFAGFTAIVSGILWLAATVLGVLSDSNGTCFDQIRFSIFNNQSYIIYKSYNTDITPPKWTYGIWSFLYTWNMLWVIYSIATMCRPVLRRTRYSRGGCVNLFPAKFHMVWWLCCFSHVGWLFLWDNKAFVASLFVQIFVVTSCIACLMLSHDLAYCRGAMLQYKRPWDLWVVRTLVQNGIIMLLTWNIFLFVINAIILLQENADISTQLTSIVAMAIIGISMLVWLVLDLAVFDRWMRYSFGLYPVITWASASVLVRNFVIWCPVTITTLTVLGLSLLATIIRVPVVVWRSYSYPLYAEQTIPYKVDTPPIKRERSVSTIL